MRDKVDMLLDIWKQSRSDLQGAQDRFRNAIHVFLVASFGISAFLLSEKSAFKNSGSQLAAAADVLLLLVFSILIAVALGEIRLGRITVEWYEDRLKQAIDNPQALAGTELFPDIKGKPRMPLRNEFLTASVALVVVAIKAVLLLCA
jgi:hypothetical protein